MAKASLIFVLLVSTLIQGFAQQKEKKSIGLGLKAGYNFAKVTGASSVNSANANGYHIGAFLFTR